MGVCTVTLSEQYKTNMTNKPNEMGLLNPFKKQWTEIFCSSYWQSCNNKKKVLSYITGEILLYSLTDSNKHDPDY